MFELELERFIQSHANWRELLQQPPYNITIKDDGKYTLLKYNQITSDFSNQIVRECRGIILCDGAVVCQAFDKFFNYGEPNADEIDWPTARVQTKIDGSLIKLWYMGVEDKWHVSTNGTIDAYKCPLEVNSLISDTFNGEYETYGELFDEAAKNSGLDYSKLNKSRVYIFELVSPYNRIVVKYDRPEIWHIGTRSRLTLKEYDEDIGVQKPKEYYFNSLEDCIEGAKNLTANEEGYVVVDAQWHRVKVKNPTYLMLHRAALNGKVTYSYLIELIRDGEVDEFVTYFPEYKDAIKRIEEKIAELVIQTDRNNAILKREYAKRVFELDKANSNFYFKKMGNQQMDYREYLFSCVKQPDRIVKALGLGEKNE